MRKSDDVSAAKQGLIRQILQMQGDYDALRHGAASLERPYRQTTRLVALPDLVGKFRIAHSCDIGKLETVSVSV
jgi:hypothetical protein